MPIRGAFPTIHTNLWNPVASCRPCVLSPSLRIAPVPGLGPGGIGMYGLSFVENYYMQVQPRITGTPPPRNPVRRSLRCVTGLRGCSHAAQNSKPRLSVAANKSCLQGWPFKIWSCAPAPYGKGTHVCAALTGGRIIAAPFFDRPSSGRRSVFHILHEHSGVGAITTSLQCDTLPKLLRVLFGKRYPDRGSTGVLYSIGNGSGRQRTVRMSECRSDIPEIHPIDGVPATVCVRVFYVRSASAGPMNFYSL